VFLAVYSTALFIFSNVEFAFLSSDVYGPSMDNLVASFVPPSIKLFLILFLIEELSIDSFPNKPAKSLFVLLRDVSVALPYCLLSLFIFSCVFL